ncbi:MAG: HEAT repeat domain-containing protein, partial [Candidatus Aminicenantes bacterium]|nr:HEAT repeat domain-containing protein [Candidatus Aminicenantes bacterium]
MNTLRNTIIWGWMILGGLTCGHYGLLSAASITPSFEATAVVETTAESPDREMDRFFKAKEDVFKRSWAAARKGFESYLENYPQGRFRDEGLYWLANSLSMLSRNEKSPEKIAALNEEALKRLDELIDRHAKSLWRDDGMALRIEIASQLVLMGKDSYTPVIEDAVRTQNKDARQLRLLALNSLTALDGAFVRPLLENILKTDKDREIRKRCVQLLGRNFSDGSLDLLKKLAADDEDGEIRKEAQSWIDRISRNNLAVFMKYNIYGSRLLDHSLDDQFPEGEIRTIPLNAKTFITAQRMADLIQPLFNNRLSPMLSSADGVLPYPGFYLQERFQNITHRAGDYQLWIKPDKLAVSEGHIAGIVEFRHRKTNDKNDFPFELKRGDAKLLTTRSGNMVSILIIQYLDDESQSKNFSYKMDPSELPADLQQLVDLATKIDKGSGGGEETVFNIFNWTVHSSRTDWSLADLVAKGGLYDLGEAKAVCKNPAGWTLSGNLILLMTEKTFMGRKAKLTDPSGQTAAEGDIIVPVDNPADFIVKGEVKAAADTSEPDYGPFKSVAVFRLGKAREIETDRKYFEADEFSRNLVSFGRSRARLPEKAVSSSSDRKWTLLGDIFWIRDKNLLIGHGALVIDPDRILKAKGNIRVPLENPSAFQVLLGETIKDGPVMEREDERNT